MKKPRGKRPHKKSKMFETDLNILLAKCRALSTPIRVFGIKNES